MLVILIANVDNIQTSELIPPRQQDLMSAALNWSNRDTL